MTIEEIKEWRNTVETHGIGIAGEFVVEIIDTLLAEVATLEKHNASSDQAVVELDQKLSIATEALARIAKQEPSTHHGLGGWDVCIQCDGDIDAARTALERIKE